MARSRRSARRSPPKVAPPRTPEREGVAVSRAAWIAVAAVAAVAVLGLLAPRWWLPAKTGSASVTAAAGHPPAGFAGSDACKSCHEAQYRAWRGSQHRLAMQPATPASVLGDFEQAGFRYAGVESRFFRRGEGFYVRTDGPDGAVADFRISYAYGVYPLQQYLVEFPDGRIQALSIAWDARPKAQGGQRWFHLYPGENIGHRDELHWTARAQNWNFMCADCHSTNVRKNYDPATDTFRTRWSEVSVGCEACHGPGSRHVEWAGTKTADPARGLAVALDERRGVAWAADPATGTSKRSAARTSSREIEVCAQCHSRRSQIAEGYHAGRPFQDHYRPALLDSDLYHADGQQRGEVYKWGSFLQSRMHGAGVTCGDCHEPHSGNLRAEGNAVCAQCHLPSKYDARAHHFHASGVRCVDCHMPAATYMVVDPRRDHSLRVPRPDLTAALGVPNACAACHADKAPRWAADAVRKWLGRDARGLQRYAGTFSGARVGAPSADGDLAALADDPTQPAIARASALAWLGRRLTPTTLPAVRRGLADGDPLLRRAAVAALERVPPAQRVALLAPLLGDPLRSVRIEAASSLAGAPGEAFSPAQRASFERAAAEYEKVQRYNADRPEARTGLAGFYAHRGRYDDAEAEYRAALAMRPPYEPAYVNFSDMYRTLRRDDRAEAVLLEGLKLLPGSAALHHAYGLALVRLDRKPEAMRALARAAELAPDEVLFAYVYAVALNSAGKAGAALAEIDRALQRHPADRDLLRAGVAFARDSGNAKAAAGYAQRLEALEASR